MSDPFLLLSNVHVNLGEVLGWGSAMVTVASAFVAATPTPNPKTFWGKIYKGIETAALLVGRAKDLGVVPSASTAGQAAFVRVAEGLIPVAETALATVVTQPAAAPAPAPTPAPTPAPAQPVA